MKVSDLTEPEQRLWRAYPRDEQVDLRTGEVRADDPADAGAWGPDRTIRAEVITALLLGAAPPEPGHRSGVRLYGARITGRLDLYGLRAGALLYCEGCVFTDAISCVETTASTLMIMGSVLEEIDAARMRMEGLLDLSGSVIKQSLRLDHARLDSDVRLWDTVIGSSIEGIAIEAAGVRVNGRLDASGLRARGTVVLTGAQVTGSVNLDDARITGAGGPRTGLRADGMMVEGSASCARIVVQGDLCLDNARITRALRLSGAQLSGPGGIALWGGGLAVGGAVWCNHGFTADGEVRFVGARLDANLAMDGARLSNPGGVALNLDRAVVGEVQGEDIIATGLVSARGVQVGIAFELTGATLEASPGERALSIESATMALLALNKMRVRGEIMVRTSRIDSRVLLMDTEVRNPGGVALRLSRTEIGADLYCDRLTAEGEVKLTQAKVAGHADFEGARLQRSNGSALDARWLTAGQLSLRTAEPVDGTLQLTHARIGVLRDDPDRWPDRLTLTGLAYEALEPRLPPKVRLAWLTRDPEGYQSQPYEQLAAHYMAMGQHAEARAVMYARERNRRSVSSPLGRAWSRVQDITTGYGYQPWRAAVWLGALLTIGSIVYGISPPDTLKPDEGPHFNAVMYTLDLLLPIVELGQERAFNPEGFYQWFSYGLIAAGWILATTIAAGIARVISRR